MDAWEKLPGQLAQRLGQPENVALAAVAPIKATDRSGCFDGKLEAVVREVRETVRGCLQQVAA